MFAKIFESENYGQLLVKIDTSPEDSTPEVRYFFEPEGLGVCSIAYSFADTDLGWEQADALFANDDLQKIESTVSAFCNLHSGGVTTGEDYE